jgi:hypothetical protein
MAGPTGLEPATSGVTGQRSNQLNYGPGCLPSETWTIIVDFWAAIKYEPSDCDPEHCPEGPLPWSRLFGKLILPVLGDIISPW